MKLLIKNGRVIDPASGTDETLDILIDNKKIVDIKPQIRSEGVKTIDASRLVVAPGFIDMHTHLREPGQEHKETIRSGSQAAAKGGFTSIACMPNTNPVNDNRGVTEFIAAEAKRKAVVNVYPIAAITLGLKGEDLTEMAELADAGAVAFSDDGHPIQDSQVMRRALEYSRLAGPVIIDHCEDKDLSESGVMHEGANSYRFGLKGIPAAAEEVMVARDIILADQTQTPVHIAHVSVKGSVELIRQAKRREIRVSAEVAPHHLLLTDEAIQDYDTDLKVNPPLRGREDVKALIKALKEGVIDVFATDHAPHTPDEKNVEFDIAPFGINGLETAVSLFLDKIVGQGIITLSTFIEMISTMPARILKLENKGQIRVGADADLTILNLNKDMTVDTSRFASKSRNSPFQGWKLRGAPAYTIVGGRVVHPL